MSNIDKSDINYESLKRTLQKKIAFADMVLKFSVSIGGEVHAIGVASKLEGHGIRSYREYFQELSEKGVVLRIQPIKMMKESDAVISEALRAGFAAAKRNILVHTYKVEALLREQAEWQRTLKDMEEGRCVPSASSVPPQRQVRWRRETIEKVLRIFEKLVKGHVQYTHGLEIMRTLATENAFKFLRIKKLIVFCGFAKQTKPEILELSKKGYTVLTGISPSRIPPNAKVWEVQLEKIKKNFPALVREIRNMQ